MDSIKPSDWYSASKSQVVAAGGGSLFAHHNLLESALMATHPDFPWDSTKFSFDKPAVEGGDDSNRYRRSLENIAKELGIKEVSILPV